MSARTQFNDFVWQLFPKWIEKVQAPLIPKSHKDRYPEGDFKDGVLLMERMPDYKGFEGQLDAFHWKNAEVQLAHYLFFHKMADLLEAMPLLRLVPVEMRYEELVSFQNKNRNNEGRIRFILDKIFPAGDEIFGLSRYVRTPIFYHTMTLEQFVLLEYLSYPHFFRLECLNNDLATTLHAPFAAKIAKNNYSYTHGPVFGMWYPVANFAPRISVTSKAMEILFALGFVERKFAGELMSLVNGSDPYYQKCLFHNVPCYRMTEQGEALFSKLYLGKYEEI